MQLKTKTKCEKCGRELKNEADSYVCSYECTFCEQCTKEMNYVCPNCSGKLEKRKSKKV